MGVGNDNTHGQYNTSLGFIDRVEGANGNPPYTSGTYNTFVGANNGSYSAGSGNTAIGYSAGRWFMKGTQNVFIGYQAGSYLVNFANPSDVGTGNNIIGAQAGYYNQADYNVFIGHQSGYSNVTGTDNVFVGTKTGYANIGSSNTFLGYQAGQSNTTGSNNLFLGWLSGQANTSGLLNVFVGGYTGYSNTSGQLNTFLGYATGSNNTTGRVNTFLGGYAGESNTTGIQNTYVGYQAGRATTTGNNNSIMGYQAGSNLTTGSNNIIIGPKSGTAVTDGSDNVLMGYNSQAEEGLQNAIAIGANSRVTASHALILGNQVNVGIGTSAPTNRLEVISQSPNTSGLTLTNLTEASPAIRTTDQFLTVNEKGEVVKARYQLRISSPAEWSDKVFSSSYQLRSLPSVATYIAKQGHLPGVPSAEQVAKDGIDLVKMNALLLEKVEELTLYSIQLANENQTIRQQLQSEHNQQQARIDWLEKQHKQEIAEVKKLVNQLLKKQ
ncbi:hypothetical protein GCM10028805_36870 [Spirosoma harenae]